MPLRNLDGASTYSILTLVSWLSSISVLGILVFLIGINALSCTYRGYASLRDSRSVAIGCCTALAAIMIAPSIQFFYHSAGYLDSFSISALMLGFVITKYMSVYCTSRKWCLIAVSVTTGVVAVAIHEMSAIAFMPTYIMLTLLEFSGCGIVSRKSTRFYFFLSVALSALAAFTAAIGSFALQVFGEPSKHYGLASESSAISRYYAT